MKRIGRYETLFWVASGGMADVHAGRRVGEAGFQKLVAIKQMRPHLASNDQFVRLFLDEARIAATVNSPHVVSTIDLDRDEDSGLFLVMELVVGSPLSRLISEMQSRGEAISPGVGAEIAAQACLGLHDAHEARDATGEWMRIVHRDVSPHNIMVGLDGRVRVTDFGVARARERNVQTTSGMVRGKPTYFSPEQARGEELDRRSDVFAMGVVAWELLVGRPLFSSKQPLLAMSKIVSEDIPLASSENPQVHPELAEVVARALVRPRDQRYQDAEAFALDLRRVAMEHYERVRPDAIAAVVQSHGGDALQRIQDGLKQIGTLDSAGERAAGESAQSVDPALRGTVIAEEEEVGQAIPHTVGVVLPDSQMAPLGSDGMSSGGRASSGYERMRTTDPSSEPRRPQMRVPRSTSEDLRFTDGGTENSGLIEAPTGVVAVVYTDLQGAEELWEAHGDAFREMMRVHDDIVLTKVREHGGYRAGRERDSFLLVFASVRDAVTCCLRAQEALHHADWAKWLGSELTDAAALVRGLRVRMGIHCGEVTTEREAESGHVHYFGSTVVRTARLCQAAHGGQILISNAIWEATEGELGECLVEDLGVHTLRGFSTPEHIRQVLPRGLATRSFPRIRARQVKKTNLPVRMDTFVGRQDELDEITRRFAEGGRLLTVLGPGGTGKTRLCQQFGHRRLAHFAGGVWFADLTEATTAAEICRILAEAVGNRLNESDPTAQISEILTSYGHALIVLDNFEQVVEFAEQTVGRWLREVPGVEFLVTSREKLRLRDEGVMPLEPLGIDQALRLFSDRAQLVSPGFRLSESNREVVTHIVEKLDRSSLAIELAAARLAVLSPEQVLERLSQRFRLLKGKGRDAPARQATLRGAIDWSWDLLDVAERAVWAQCAVFRGGFTLAAAEAVVDLDMFEDAPWVMDVLQSLHDKSLLQVYHPEGTSRRFRMYETIREYGREKLSKAGAVFPEDDAQRESLTDEDQPTGKVATRNVMLRHAEFFARFGGDSHLRSLDRPGGVVLQREMKQELDNLRLAIDIALTAGKPDRAACAAVAASEVFSRAGPVHLTQEICERVLGRVQSEFPLSDEQRARLLVRRAASFLFSGGQDEAAAEAGRALEVAARCGAWAAWCSATSIAAMVLLEKGKIAEARELMIEAIKVAAQHELPEREGMLWANTGLLGFPADSPYAPRHCYEKALALFQQAGNVRLEGAVLGNLGHIAIESLELEDAAQKCEAALVLMRDLGNLRDACWLVGSLGQIALYRGDLEAAKGYLDEAVHLARDLHWKVCEVRHVGMRAEVLARQGDLRAAASELSQARELLQESPHEVERMGLLCREGIIKAIGGETGAAEVLLCELEEAVEDLEGDHPLFTIELRRLAEAAEASASPTA